MLSSNNNLSSKRFSLIDVQSLVEKCFSWAQRCLMKNSPPLANEPIESN